jgi:2-keto-4-pentenoate hydratase
MPDSNQIEAARQLVNARTSGRPIATLPPDLIPASLEEVFAIQHRVAAHFGPVGGWKVGAPSADATPITGPMPAAWIEPTQRKPPERLRGVEAEIAFLLGHDLPARAPDEAPYTPAEVYAAVDSCHPAIELLESALDNPLLPELRMSQLADLQMHGGFVPGPRFSGWSPQRWDAFDFNREMVTLLFNGKPVLERTGSNTSGNLLRLLPWLANEGAARTGGLRAGQWITTGSWTGAEFAPRETLVEVRFSSAGLVTFPFGR